MDSLMHEYRSFIDTLVSRGHGTVTPPLYKAKKDYWSGYIGWIM